MDPRLQEMLDHFEIRRTLSEYCHGLDRMDEVRVAGVYAKDSLDTHGPFNCTGQEFAVQVLQVMKGGASFADAHLLGQSLIKVDGDTAGADTYFLSTCVRHEDAAPDSLLLLGGRYADTFVREDGRWKIKSRVCVRDWAITLPVESDWTEGMGFAQGQRSGDDPSFKVLGLTHSGVPGQD
jgi:hypothetical protein